MEAPIFPPRLHDPSRPSSRWRLNRLRRLGGKSLFLPGKRTGFLGQLTRTKHSRQGVRHSAVIRDRYLTPTVGIFSINDTSMRAQHGERAMTRSLVLACVLATIISVSMVGVISIKTAVAQTGTVLVVSQQSDPGILNNIL